jgi:hypothetical protein
MIHFAEPAKPALPVSSPDLETDPVKILGRRMKELAAQGRTVDKAALLGATDFTGAEIDQYGEAAADHARKLVRGEA